ncbi:hypothetical protein niasHT_000034 [Heterodera trifolii]|uniref:QLQ domain-containing protein n=1 Tax=Heterodera trifolii TaxID=157864 RepID=A0ABD2M8N5_9BILA
MSSALAQKVRDNYEELFPQSKEAAFSRRSQSAWANITSEINAEFGSSISEKQCKEKWHNLKKTAKRENADEQKHHRGTGGGPKRLESKDPGLQIITDTMGESASFKGFPGGRSSVKTDEAYSDVSTPTSVEKEEDEDLTPRAKKIPRWEKNGYEKAFPVPSVADLQRNVLELSVENQKKMSDSLDSFNSLMYLPKVRGSSYSAGFTTNFVKMENESNTQQQQSLQQLPSGTSPQPQQNGGGDSADKIGPDQMRLLSAQIAAYKMLARNEPVPRALLREVRTVPNHSSLDWHSANFADFETAILPILKFNASFAATGEKLELNQEETMLIIRRLHAQSVASVPFASAEERTSRPCPDEHGGPPAQAVQPSVSVPRRGGPVPEPLACQGSQRQRPVPSGGQIRTVGPHFVQAETDQPPSVDLLSDDPADEHHGGLLQVESQLPEKTEYVIKCDMSALQRPPLQTFAEGTAH